MTDFYEFKTTIQPIPAGKPTLGWFCTYTPVEILYAAGFETYGIRKSSGAETEDVYLGRPLCPYIHSIFGGALASRYSMLEGVVIAHSCECLRRLYDGWRQLGSQVTPAFCHLLDVPTVNTPSAVDYFEKNLQQLVKTLERQFDRKVTDEALHEAITLFNHTRSLLQRLYELRKHDHPPVTGSQVMEILDMAMTTDKKEFNRRFEPFLTRLENQESSDATRSRKQRLMVFGSVFNPEIIKFLEQDDIGGIVVCEDACNGMRFFDTVVEPTGNPLKSLSSGYLGKAPCPRMAGELGVDYLLDLISQYRIDGLIYYIPKYCENLYLEFPYVSEKLDDLGVPYKRLEGEISGDLNKIELKSFIEMIELKKEMADFQ